jgi:hypothetical protein
MHDEAAPMDVADSAELLRLAEEVQASGRPRLLKRGDQPLALLTPVQPTKARRRRPRSKPLDRSDPLFNIIGILHWEGPTDVSENKHSYLAEAYEAELGDPGQT